MRYSLRTPVVVMLLGGPVLALAWIEPCAFFAAIATVVMFGWMWFCYTAPPRVGG